MQVDFYFTPHSAMWEESWQKNVFSQQSLTGSPLHSAIRWMI